MAGTGVRAGEGSPSGMGLWGMLVSAGAAVGCAWISIEVRKETPVTAQPAQLAA